MSINPIPEGYHTATPYLVIREVARAVEFYKQVFNASELLRLTEADGNIVHIEIKIGDSPIMISPESPEWGAYSPQSPEGGASGRIHLHVDDVDEVVIRAVEAGAQVLIPVADQFYGQRSGRIEDPFGHIWIIATHKEDLTLEEMQTRFNEFMKQMGPS